jgi:hypothetical protein
MVLLEEDYLRLRILNRDKIMDKLQKNDINYHIDYENLCLLDQTSLDKYQEDFIICTKNLRVLLIPKNHILKNNEYYNILTIPFNEESLNVLNYIKFVGELFKINENLKDLNLYFKLYPNNLINSLYIDIIDKNTSVNNNYIHIDTVINMCKKINL